MGILIDTSVIVALERSRSTPDHVLEEFSDEPAFVAAITASELLHGVHRANSAQRRGRREQFVESILTLLPVLPFDIEVARHHARIWSDLARQGLIIGAHDLQIAATAIRHEHRVLTDNRREFDRVEGLLIESWQ